MTVKATMEHLHKSLAARKIGSGYWTVVPVYEVLESNTDPCRYRRTRLYATVSRYKQFFTKQQPRAVRNSTIKQCRDDHRPDNPELLLTPVKCEMYGLEVKMRKLCIATNTHAISLTIMATKLLYWAYFYIKKLLCYAE